jgi:hypothetical protein
MAQPSRAPAALIGLVGVAVRGVLTRDRSSAPAVASATVAILAVALLASGSAAAQTDTGTHDHGMFHMGNAAPYPQVREASRANRRKARRIRVATLRAAPRFDTVEEAARLGYVSNPELSPIYVPGLQHFRKPRTRTRKLFPALPPALVFWCPSVGDCSLAAAMYRAKDPPTYGGLLGWHRHFDHGRWMTHVWLTPSLHSTFAQCAPFNALHAHNPLLTWEPYRPDVPMIDEPCPDTTALA